MGSQGLKNPTSIVSIFLKQTVNPQKKFHEIVNFCLVLLSETKKYKNIITEIKFSV